MALTSGSATLSDSTLAVGSHTISAIYSSYPNFSTSTSAQLTQTVNLLTASNLQPVLNPGGTTTLQTTTPTDAHDAFAALNGLDPATTPSTNVILDLGGQTIQDTIV